jgi:hypothetical protein
MRVRDMCQYEFEYRYDIIKESSLFYRRATSMHYNMASFTMATASSTGKKLRTVLQ